MYIVTFNHVNIEQSLSMKWSPAKEKCNDNNSWKIRDSVVLFFQSMHRMGVTQKRYVNIGKVYI